MRVFGLAMSFPRPTNMPMLIIKVNISLQLMGIKVTQSAILFLDSIHQFDQKKVHMMLVLMFDPKFKNIFVVNNYVRKETTTTTSYDSEL
jgi:replication-associated recombination protein RarA